MKKLFSAILTVALTGTLLSACGSKTDNTQPPAANQNASTPAADPNAALLEAAKKEGKLVVYGATPEPELVKVLAAFKKKYPFIDVSEYFRAGGSKLFSKLIAEVDANQLNADIYAPANVGDVIVLKERGLLMEYKSPEAAKIPANMQDAGFWTTYRINAIPMAYNPKILPDADAPKSWNDLLDPKYKGKIMFEDSASGSQFAQWYLLKQALGEEFFTKLAKQEPKIVSSSGLIVQGLLTGEILVAGQTESFRIYQEGTLKGAPIKGIFPKEGVPGVLNPISIVKGAKHPAAAKLFVDFLLSAEGQTLHNAELLGAYSSRSDVSGPKGLPELGQVNLLLPKDNKDYADNNPVFAKKWAELFEAKK